jgi:membrane protein involved in colicin uptake
MNPDELARIRAEKLERERKETEEHKRAEASQKAARDADAAAAKDALANTIVPYLERVKSAMNGALVVGVTRDTDNQIAGVNLQLDGRAAKIGLYGSSLQFAIQSRTYRSDFDPYAPIRSAADVSEEGLGQFIKALMTNG